MSHRRRKGDLDESLAGRLKPRAVVKPLGPVSFLVGPDLEVRLVDVLHVGRLGVARPVPNVEFGGRRAQQAGHGLGVAGMGSRLLGGLPFTIWVM